MKKLRLTIVGLMLLLAAPTVWAQDGIEFFHGEFAKAQIEAEEQGKLIFMDAYATWCGPCKWMARNSFTDAQVSDLFNASFVNLKIDMERGEGTRLARIYRIRAYPTLFIMNAEGEVLEKMEGALPPEALKQWAEDAIAKHAPDMNRSDQEVESGDMGATTDPTALEAALLAAIEAGDQATFDALSESLLSSAHPEKEILYVDAQRAWAISSESPATFVSRVHPFLESGAELNAMTLTAAAWYALELTKDEDDLTRAAGWARRSMDLEPNYFNHDTYAQIMHHLGETEEAKKYGKMAVEMAKEEGMNADESVGRMEEAPKE